jgi:hypothetical protein
MILEYVEKQCVLTVALSEKEVVASVQMKFGCFRV